MEIHSAQAGQGTICCKGTRMILFSSRIVYGRIGMFYEVHSNNINENRKMGVRCILFLWTHPLSLTLNDNFDISLSLVSDNDFYLAQYNDPLLYSGGL